MGVRQFGKIAMGLPLVLAFGCGRGVSLVSEERLSRGLVIVLPGIDGKSYLNRAMIDGLRRGGVDYALELHDWTLMGRWTFLYNLRAERRNRRQAGKIARRIAEYHQQYPGRPVFLFGQSAGAAMSAWIAEALGEDDAVDGIVMLAAALSPAYRLEDALARSRRGIVSYYSQLDWLFLGAGTTVFGSSDGPRGSAAGRVGFSVPPGGGRDGLYAKLFQTPWRRHMIGQSNLGGHLTSTAAPFVERYVAPLIKARAWDEELIRSLTRPAENADGKTPDPSK